MQIRNVMTRRVVAATPHTTVCQIANKLLEGQFSGLPVVDADRKVVGVVTELDVIRAMQEGKDLDSTRAEQIMSRQPTCVEMDASLEEAINLMQQQNIIRLPVVHGGKLEGVIARCDVINVHLKDKGHQPFVEYEYFMDEGT